MTPEHGREPATGSSSWIEALPEWPSRTIGVLATLDSTGPHAIPVSAPVRAGDRRVLLSLHRARGSLQRLRESPEVALVILAAGNIAFTARGRARVLQQPMAADPGYAAIAIDVEQIDDHRQPAFEVDASVGRRWLDENERDALGRRVAALTELAGTMTGISLRHATLADAPRLAELVQAAYGHYVQRIGGLPGPMTEDYAQVVRAPRVTVAQRAGEIVGLIVLDLGDRALVIDNVAVDPAHQGSGVGRALLEHAEETARAAGLGWIHLWTHELMTENLALYSRIGYTRYDPGQCADARLVYLRKELG